MRVIGIDPGLSEIKAVMVTRGPAHGMTVYGPSGDLASFISAPDPARLVPQLAALAPDLVLVEMARGSIASARDADPVLRNNLTAGEILGWLRAAGLPAALVASGGDATGWNWRTALGVKGKGAAAKDAATCQIVRVLAHNHQDVPHGTRGGHIQDWWDAAGIAFAGLHRAALHPKLPPLEAVNHTSAFEQIKLDRRKTRKALNKQRRAVLGGSA